MNSYYLNDVMKVKYDFGEDEVAVKLTSEQLKQRKEKMERNNVINNMYYFYIKPDMAVLKARIASAVEKERERKKSRNIVVFDAIKRKSMFLNL